ncbi:MAG TPA: hypothetical protein VM784_09645 [Actinomycetota bacterium]|nr:hypothetical protein [Actinomycetota bacterium]
MVTLTPREHVERELGRPLTDDAWSFLEDGGYTDPELYKPREVADIVRTLGMSYSKPVPPHLSGDIGTPMVPGAELLEERAKAIADFMAKAAEGDNGVRQFRSKHLPGGLIAANDIHDFVTALYRDHLPTAWRVGEPELSDAAWWKAHNEVRFGRPRLRYSLAYWMEPRIDGWIAGRWPVPVRSPLAELGELSEHLADKYRWNQYEAAAWALTGLSPHVTPITGSSTVGTNYTRDIGSYDVTSRVTITLDPTVSPEQLAAWWREVRHRMLPGRYRPQQVKALRLARFAARSDPDATWEEDRRRWNAEVGGEHPDWRYKDVANFRRHAKDAVRRLLYVGIESP